MDADHQLMHDLRNAASVIRGAASQLHEDRGSLSPEMLGELTDMIARRSDVLVRLLDDLAIVHQVERGDLRVCLQRVALSEVCDYALSDVRSTGRTTVTVDVPDDVAVLGDPVRLTQVLDNLVTNALRYGGPNVTVTARRNGSHVDLDVCDDGPGVPPALESAIFDVYARGPESRRVGGSGLGLAIVRELCAAMGGMVSYARDPGTRFRVTLPAPPPVQGWRDSPDAAGHAVTFWQDTSVLVDRITGYTGAGLAAGEAVVVAARPDHLTAVHHELLHHGFEVDRMMASGQYVPMDATELHRTLKVDGRLDRTGFDHAIATTLARVRNRWQEVRVFGEVVDVFWQAGDGDLALELEALWDDLRGVDGFPLLCGYHGDTAAGMVSRCHDRVVAA